MTSKQMAICYSQLFVDNYGDGGALRAKCLGLVPLKSNKFYYAYPNFNRP